MSARRIALLTLICLAVAAAVLMISWRGDAGPKVSLYVHAGAGIRPPLDELGAAFQKQTGIRVDYNYKGSGCLLADICFSKKGDVYIPGETFYMDQARKKDLVSKDRVVAGMSTVIIVQPGNPKKVSGLRDLGRPGLRVGLGDPEAVAVGRAAAEALVKAGAFEQAKRNVVMSALNVVELGNAVKLKHLDAAVVWDATASLYQKDEVTTLEIPTSWRANSPIPVGVLEFSRHPQEAERFMHFLASSQAARVFQKHGYSAPPTS